MKRVHIHVNVEASSFDASIDFYRSLFGAEPSLQRPRYAKWLLDDPAVNIVVEVLEIAGDAPGIHHVGIQVESEDELETIRAALQSADAPLLEVGHTICCFAKSEKNWTVDPQGLRWETFRSLAESECYGARTAEELDHYVDDDAGE